MEFFFDTETTGLPGRKGNRLASFKDLESYNSARIVSISWIVTQQQKVVGQAYYVVKPDGFEIPQEASNIHGISTEEADKTGCSIQVIFDQLKSVLPNCSTLVAHNIDFDINVLRSELHRYKQIEILDLLSKKNLVCTMKKGKEVLKTRAYPKLAALYKALYNEDMENAHNAQYDTIYCYKCYIKMFPLDKSIFFFGDRPVKLTDTQKDIVYEDSGKHMLVIACAGAGKTLTVICRVKHLIQSGVQEDTIMLTTFTRDAANDMKNKLFDIMGYTPEVTVGTIDSIAFKYASNKRKELKDVSEYGHDFLNAITRDPTIVAKYKYLFVDEFQDINEVQFKIIQVFYNNGCQIFGVGDDAQNIYTFRGSKVEYILNFEKYFQNSKTIFLMENFRSTREIINMANASMEKNEDSIPKKMCPGRDIVGPKPHVRYFETQGKQNSCIITQIKALLDKGIAEHDIAILSPINQPLYLIEELLTKQGIKNVYLDGKCDVKTSKKPWHVCMCTIHKSKGLEWEHVFMINMSDEVIPKTKTPSHVEESRRLFYVGITRARQDLYIYYNVMAATMPYVTRYVSELDKDLYTTDEGMDTKHFGISELEIAPVDFSVTKLIENLDGGDYIKMKELGIIPTIEKRDIKRTKIYDSFAYVKAIENDDLYSDFGIFIEKVIKRDIASMLGNRDICRDKHTIMCLANIKLEPGQYKIYCQYKGNFKQNLKKIKPYLFDIHGNKYKIKMTLEQNNKFINELHLSSLLLIITQIKQRAEYFHIEPHKVPVFSKTFLPQDFEALMEKSLKIYQDITKSTTENIDSIWELAKCKKIVTEYRRRLLYKNVNTNEIHEAYTPLYQHLRTTLMDFLLTKITDPKAVVTDEDLELKEGMYGELDLRIQDIVIDYKTSINDDISMQWLVQLLCYKVLADSNGKRINKIGILNALRGWYGEIDISAWNKHHELVAYLLQKREIVSQR